MKEIKVRPFKEIIFRGAHPKEVKEEVTKQEVPPIISGIREGWIKVKEAELSSEVKEMRLQAIGCLGIVMKAHKVDIITRSESVNAIQELVKAGL